jgi:hypothetical protein
MSVMCRHSIHARLITFSDCSYVSIHKNPLVGGGGLDVCVLSQLSSDSRMAVGVQDK